MCDLFSLTASENRHSQRDVKTAFLNVPIDIELDVLLPEGFGTKTTTSTLPLWAPSAGLDSHSSLAVLTELGFSTFLPDVPCLFKDKDPKPIFLVLGVDVIILSAPAEGIKRRGNIFKGSMIKDQVFPIHHAILGVAQI